MRSGDECVSSPSDETHYLIITVFIYFSSSDVFATLLSFDFPFSLMIFQELNFTFLCFSSYLFVWCICMVTFSFFGLAASVVLLLGWLQLWSKQVIDQSSASKLSQYSYLFCCCPSMLPSQLLFSFSFYFFFFKM